jgi:hypothetical protein
MRQSSPELAEVIGEEPAQIDGEFLRELGRKVGELVAHKNAAYGDSFARSGEVLSVLYPDGIRPEQYVDVLATVRVLDKLFRIAADKGAFGESPWQDVAGYGLLGTANDAAKAKKR